MGIESLNSLSINPISTPTAAGKMQNPAKPGEFANKLESLLNNPLEKEITPAQPLALKFSNHAVERMQSRGIHFPPTTLQKIENAVNRASEKGARETLVIAEDAAMIVNIENKTVVTVMDKKMLKENIFTNIDTAVMV